MNINLIDSKGHEETLFNNCSEKLRQRVLEKKSEIEMLGLKVIESDKYYDFPAIPFNLYNIAVDIVYKGYNW